MEQGLKGNLNDLIGTRNAQSCGQTFWRTTVDGGKTWRTPGIEEAFPSSAANKTLPSTGLRGMKPTVAVIGTVAVGALAYGALKLLRHKGPSASEGEWVARISAERQAQRDGSVRS